MRSADSEHQEPLVLMARSAPAALGKAWWPAAALVFGVAVIYGPTIASLARMWWSSDDYSHGILVPFISLYFVWMKRDVIARTDATPAIWLGASVIAAAGLLLHAGKIGGVVVLQEISLLVMIVGLVLTLLGPAMLRVLAVPIAYLVLMIKIFGEGGDRFHWPFQMLAADIGVLLLKIFGYPVFQDAQYIHLPRITLDVAAACSGLRFLVSIIAIGIPLAYLTQRTWFAKIGLVSFGIAVAVLANGLRVALIGVWTSNGGDLVHGPFHLLSGVFVSWVGFVALFAGVWLFRRLSPGVPGVDRGHADFSAGVHAAIPGSGRRAAWAATAALLLGIGVSYYAAWVRPVSLAAGLDALPATINGWRGEERPVDDQPWRIAGADDELLRIYRDSEGRSVRLYIAYFRSQEQGHDLVNYKTSRLLHRDERTIPIMAKTGDTEYVNRADLNALTGRSPVLFWYVIGERTTPDSNRAKLFTIWDGITARRTNGAVVVVSSAPERPGDAQRAADAQRFAEDAWRAIQGHLSASSSRQSNRMAGAQPTLNDGEGVQ